MNFNATNFSKEQLISLYSGLVLPRMIEDKMLILLRQGKISKWFSGIGQEAICVGATLALQSHDYILPLHRNLGVFTSRNLPLEKLFAQWQGKKNGYTKGRDRSFHFGSLEHRIIGMISHLGAMLPVADGLALASNLVKNISQRYFTNKTEQKYSIKEESNSIALVFSGDGGASEGDFHEALNVAAVWNLPVIFLIENNGYGLSTPSNQQFKCKQFIDKAIGYGVQGIQVDGNNILEVYNAVSLAAAQIRQNRQPIILEAMTFRIRGHEEASGTKYVPKQLTEEWIKKDPLINYEEFLLKNNFIQQKEIDEIKQNHKINIEQAVATMLVDTPFVADEQEELNDVYATEDTRVFYNKNIFSKKYEGVEELESRIKNVSQDKLSENQFPEKRLIDGLSEGLYQAMEHNPNIILMGQDIAEYGGVFKITDGFLDKFGASRVRNTPLCESAIIGAGMGLSLRNFVPVIEMQFADFVSCGYNQIVNNLAKTHYRWGENLNITLRMPTGAGVGAGPFHSQSNEAWFTKIAGLKVVYPATPAAAKGLLVASIEDPNPVIFFEHKFLYRSAKGVVPNEYYSLPLGKAHKARTGADLTVITYGLGVHWAMEYAATSKHDIEVLDLQTLVPLDFQAIYNSVKKTSRCLVLHEDTQTCGFGAEVAALISEQCFSFLDAPVLRLGSLDTPVPFNTALESGFLANKKLDEKIKLLMSY